jgi:hypothetical protein
MGYNLVPEPPARIIPFIIELLDKSLLVDGLEGKLEMFNIRVRL